MQVVKFILSSIDKCYETISFCYLDHFSAVCTLINNLTQRWIKPFSVSCITANVTLLRFGLTDPFNYCQEISIDKQ